MGRHSRGRRLDASLASASYPTLTTEIASLTPFLYNYPTRGPQLSWGIAAFDAAPSSSGLGYLVLIQEIGGSNPPGVTNLRFALRSYGWQAKKRLTRVK